MKYHVFKKIDFNYESTTIPRFFEEDDINNIYKQIVEVYMGYEIVPLFDAETSRKDDV